MRERGWQSLRQRLLPSGRTCVRTNGCCAQNTGTVLGSQAGCCVKRATWCITHTQRYFVTSIGSHRAVGKQPLLLHALDCAVPGAGEAKQPLVEALTAGTACSPMRCRDRLRRAG